MPSLRARSSFAVFWPIWPAEEIDGPKKVAQNMDLPR